MGTFEYKAVNKQGNTTSGTIEAENKNTATATLIKQGYRPLVIKQQKTGFDPNNIKIPGIGGKVKSKDIVVFTRQLATMVNAGVPLIRALATLQQQTENEAFKEILENVTKDVESGMTLADSMEKHPKAFSEIYVNMVKAGEAGGILDDILKKLATQQEKDASMKKKIKSSMSYPLVLVVIMIIAFFILTVWVLPSMTEMIVNLANEDTELPLSTRALVGLSDFMSSYWWVIAAAMIAGVFAFKRWIKTPSGRLTWDKLLLKIPVVNSVVSKIAIARFARTFASLMAAGVPVNESLNITASAIGNKVIEQELRDASKAVINGQQLSEPLSESTIFPPIVSQMLAVGEETGQTDVMLIKVADFYEEEAETVIEALASIIEPLMIVVMGVAVGIIGIAVFGPITSLTQTI